MTHRGRVIRVMVRSEAAVHECPELKITADLAKSPWISLEFRSVLFNPAPENATACCSEFIEVLLTSILPGQWIIQGFT